MKKIILAVFSFCVSIQLSAQKIEVEESGDALITSVYDTDIDDVQKQWKRLMKDYDGKVDIKKEKVTATGALIKTMGSCTFNITASMEKRKDDEVRLMVLFDPVASLDQQAPDRSKYMSEAKRIVKDFAYKLSLQSVSEKEEGAQKLHDKLVGQHEDLMKANKSLHNDIVNYYSKISDARRDSTINVKEMKKKQEEIDAQKKAVEKITEKKKALD